MNIKTSSWVPFPNSSSGLWAFIWSGCPLPVQTLPEVELVTVSYFSFSVLFYVLLWWCLCVWMTWYDSQLLCICFPICSLDTLISFSLWMSNWYFTLKIPQTKLLIIEISPNLHFAQSFHLVDKKTPSFQVLRPRNLNFSCLFSSYFS